MLNFSNGIRDIDLEKRLPVNLNYKVYPDPVELVDKDEARDGRGENDGCK